MLSDYIHWGGFSLLPQLFSPQQEREFLSFVSPSVGKNQLSKYVNKDLCMKGIRLPGRLLYMEIGSQKIKMIFRTNSWSERSGWTDAFT